MTQKEQKAFIERMNLGKQQSLFFTEDPGTSFTDPGRAARAECGYVFVCVSAYL